MELKSVIKFDGEESVFCREYKIKKEKVEDKGEEEIKKKNEEKEKFLRKIVNDINLQIQKVRVLGETE